MRSRQGSGAEFSSPCVVEASQPTESLIWLLGAWQLGVRSLLLRGAADSKLAVN